MIGAELAALVQLLNRFTAMLSEAERLWIQGLIQHLAADITAREREEVAKNAGSKAPLPDIAPVDDPA